MAVMDPQGLVVHDRRGFLDIALRAIDHKGMRADVRFTRDGTDALAQAIRYRCGLNRVHRTPGAAG